MYYARTHPKSTRKSSNVFESQVKKCLNTSEPNPKSKESKISLFEQLICYDAYLPSMLTELLRKLVLNYDLQCTDMKILILRLNLRLLINNEKNYKHTP